MLFFVSSKFIKLFSPKISKFIYKQRSQKYSSSLRSAAVQSSWLSSSRFNHL